MREERAAQKVEDGSRAGRRALDQRRHLIAVATADDAMPLTVRIKALMLAESIASFPTVGLVAARAVNILNT